MTTLRRLLITCLLSGLAACLAACLPAQPGPTPPEPSAPAEATPGAKGKPTAKPAAKAESKPAPKPVTYDRREPKLHLVLPGDYTLQPGGALEPTLLLRAVSRRGPSLVIRLRPLEAPATVAELGEDFVGRELDALRRALPGVKPEVPAPVRVAGRTALALSYTHRGRTYRRLWVPNGEWLLEITYGPIKDNTGPPWRSLELAPPPPAATAAPPAPTTEPWEAAYTLDPPRLAQARRRMRRMRKKHPHDPLLVARQAEVAALQALTLKHLGTRAEPVDWRSLRARVVAAWRRDPRNPVLLRALGLAKLMEGNRAKALRYLRRAARLDPRDAANWLALALAASDPHQQERLARRALEARPGMPAARLVLAWALEAQGKGSLAVPLYEAVLAAYPRHRAALRGLGRLLMDQPQGRDRAGRLLARLLKLDPGDQASRFNLALVRLAQKRFAEALRLVNTLLAANPHDAAAHNLKGLALAGLGRLHQAQAAYQAALKADPKHVPALYNLGVLCATRLKDVPCARQAFRRFLDLEPKGKRAEKVERWLVRHGG